MISEVNATSTLFLSAFFWGFVAKQVQITLGFAAPLFCMSLSYPCSATKTMLAPTPTMQRPCMPSWPVVVDTYMVLGA
jgi:hypothetical protein